jgi:peptide/nickel transport system substrate-binding protein
MSTWLLATAAVATVPIAAGASAGSAQGATVPRATPVNGGTAYWAESPHEPPNWILPFGDLQYFSVANIQDFQQLMYRPLYWVGIGNQPVVNPSYSLADPPVLSDGGKSVTVTLKDYKWSDGSPVDAQSLIFDVNMIRAERDDWAMYALGEFPDNVVSVTAASATSKTVTLHMNRAYNPQWLTLNQLDALTPMPLAWDITHLADGKPAAPGSGGCSSMTWDATTKQDCAAVWRFLSDDNGASTSPQEAADTATYATNPLWQVVDGPWRLSSFQSTNGLAQFVPNTQYSGPAPHLAKFVEMPTRSWSQEESLLQQRKITVGFLADQSAPDAPAPGKVGPNPPGLQGQFDIALQPSWSVNYFTINFSSKGDNGTAGHIFSQLYIRQAMQMLVDQDSLLKTYFHNYGAADDGPVPTQPASPYLSTDQAHDALAYDVAAAVNLLEEHGWTLSSGKAAVCSSGPKCGTGIPTGTKLSLQMIYAGGNPTLAGMVAAQVAALAHAGILLTTKALPFDMVLDDSIPCRIQPGAKCTWEIADWGGGWLYDADFLPTGELQWTTDAGSNNGDYSSLEMDKLIKATLTAPNLNAFLAWENYAALQEPVIWQPDPSTIDEVATNLGGFAPSSVGNINPEAWYFTSHS